MTSPSPVSISPVEDIVADMRASRIVILVDEEDRENEGDLVIAADHITPEAINFMARHARGLICLTLSRALCERLQLPPMVARNGAKHATAFTVSIEAAEGVTTGISAADRARTVQAAVAPNATASDLVQHAGRDKAQVTRVLSGLRERGLLDARPDESDRRSTRLTLSASGTEAHLAVQRQGERLAQTAIADLSEAERGQLLALLRRVQGNLEAE